MYKSFLVLLSSLFVFTACNPYKEVVKTLPNEILQADECKDTKDFEVDCYELISKRNSIALIRLGIIDESKKMYEDAYKKYTLAKEQKNFYANALLANLYSKGLFVKKDTKKALELLEDTSEVDPIAAYKLAIYEKSKKDYDKEDVITYLSFAGNKGLISAQNELIKIYSKIKDEKNLKYWKEKKASTKKDFVKKVYGF